MQGREFSIDIVNSPDAARVSVAGEVDLATAHELRSVLQGQCQSRTPVLLDLRRVAFMDAAGLTVILWAVASAKSNGWDLGIDAVLSRAVSRIAEVAGVVRLLPLVPA
jgi:anti-anti-sigma factor